VCVRSCQRDPKGRLEFVFPPRGILERCLPVSRRWPGRPGCASRAPERPRRRWKPWRSSWLEIGSSESAWEVGEGRQVSPYVGERHTKGVGGKRSLKRPLPTPCLLPSVATAACRMVRILVATAIQLAVTEAKDAPALGGEEGEEEEEDDEERAGRLLRTVMFGSREATARAPAPALGLCFAGVGYDGAEP
jgi:hypothetical protein